MILPRCGSMWVPVVNAAVISSSQSCASVLRVKLLACSLLSSSTYLARQRVPTPAYQSEFDNMLWAFMRYTDPLREISSGDMGYLEYFTQEGGGTAYTISSALTTRTRGIGRPARISRSRCRSGTAGPTRSSTTSTWAPADCSRSTACSTPIKSTQCGCTTTKTHPRPSTSPSAPDQTWKTHSAKQFAPCKPCGVLSEHCSAATTCSDLLEGFWAEVVLCGVDPSPAVFERVRGRDHGWWRTGLDHRADLIPSGYSPSISSEWIPVAKLLKKALIVRRCRSRGSDQ